MFRISMASVALTTVLIGVPVALAHHGHGSHDGHGEHVGHGGHSHHVMRAEHCVHGVYSGIHLPPDAVLADWGCNGQMIATLRDLQERFAVESAALGAEIAAAESKMAKIRNDDQASESALHEAIEDYFSARSDLTKLRATAAVEFRETIGDDLFARIHESHR